MYKNSSRSFGRTSIRPNGSSLASRFRGNNRPTQKRSGRGAGGSIDISSFIKKASEVIPEKAVVLSNATFSQFALNDHIQENVAKKNFIAPTQIQDRAIPPILEGRDIIGLASTGTGKTAAFLLPLINKIMQDRTQKVLIMAPTRELAQQIEEELRHFAKSTKLFGAICVGGMPIGRQISDLHYNPHFVIGTPGRLKDLADKGYINYGGFKTVVLDEVDHMLDMGFIDPITDIMNALPKERQTLFFSATMPERISLLAQKFLTNPVVVKIAVGSTTKNVEQDVVRVRGAEEKLAKLHELLANKSFEKVLIFSETKRDVEKLTTNLIKGGHKAVSIHGDKRQRERMKALEQFSNNDASILIATDVAARGLDIKDITHVINYTVPQTYDAYIHRIGRTGRGNAKGKALTFV